MAWIYHPVLWHSSRVPSGYKYSAMTDEQKLLIVTRWHDWYTADWDYAQTTVEFLCAGIGIMVIFNVYFLLNKTRTKSTPQPPGIIDRIVAAARYANARQFYIRAFNYFSPPMSGIIGVAGIFTFLMALMLAVRPFYWPNEEMGHSPPIATRSGWISVAIMPFMIAFAAKINWIAITTGTSHEKLQVFHRWTALFMYITSLVHTFPFIINNIMMGEMVSAYKTSPWYWTGIAALVPQTYLIFTSWGIFRNRGYEVFKKLHFIASGIFMAALFIHVNFRLTSWDYFWATLGLYGSAWFLRVVRTHYNSNLIGLPSSIQIVSNRLGKVTIKTPHRFKWRPGQHVFVRVVSGVSFFSSHPFTIASLHSDGKVELVFRVREGITKTLHDSAVEKASRSVRILLDGPYGGVPKSLRTYDAVYLLAGGSGVTFTLPLLRDLIDGFKTGMTCSRVEFILAVRERSDLAWLEDYLSQAQLIGADKLSVRVHITGETSKIKQLDDSDSIKDVSSVDGADESIPPQDDPSCRPNLPSIIHNAFVASVARIAIIACGPESFLYDVRNATAEAQLTIVDGFGKCKDLFLHTENYSW